MMLLDLPALDLPALGLIALDIDPNVVKPGWTPLIITVGLALVMVLLFISMRRQFRRIDVNRAASETDDEQGGGVSSPPTGSPTGTS